MGNKRERLGPVSQRCVSQESCTGWGQGSVSGWISPAMVNSIPGNRSRKGQPAQAGAGAGARARWGWKG